MEPGHEEQKDKVPRKEEKQGKPRRFRIVKLEERIAPGNGHGNGPPPRSGPSCRSPFYPIC
jgi:hypothetical protein